MSKKLLALLAVMLVMVAFAACGSDDDNSSSSSSSSRSSGGGNSAGGDGSSAPAATATAAAFNIAALQARFDTINTTWPGVAAGAAGTWAYTALADGAGNTGSGPAKGFKFTYDGTAVGAQTSNTTISITGGQLGGTIVWDIPVGGTPTSLSFWFKGQGNLAFQIDIAGAGTNTNYVDMTKIKDVAEGAVFTPTLTTSAWSDSVWDSSTAWKQVSIDVSSVADLMVGAFLGMRTRFTSTGGIPIIDVSFDDFQLTCSY